MTRRVKQDGPEDLLWELTHLQEAQPQEAQPQEAQEASNGCEATEEMPDLPNSVLKAYRLGRLTDEEARRVEWCLARSAESRERLTTLAGIEAAPLSETARRRFLAAVASSRKPTLEPATPARPTSTPWVSGWWLAAAAAVVILAGGLWLGRSGPSETGWTLPGIDASIHGLAVVRNGNGESSDDRRFTTAEPDTAVTVGIDVHPPRAGLAAGLYVYQSERRTVVRLPLEATWESRGEARFRASAQSLVGSDPGTYQLFAVIARAGSLPPDRILAAGEEPAAAFLGRDVKVEPVRLQIVEETSSSHSEEASNVEGTGI